MCPLGLLNCLKLQPAIDFLRPGFEAIHCSQILSSHDHATIDVSSEAWERAQSLWKVKLPRKQQFMAGVQSSVVPSGKLVQLHAGLPIILEPEVACPEMQYAIQLTRCNLQHLY